ncbi:MAG: hypothetical protein LC791_20840, partial [Acidobacteria bacterium]|nr:hypothetical protein [Acidobacteriota bacterium]
MGLLASSILALSGAQQPVSDAVAIDSDDIGGVVTGPNGPEAGVFDKTGRLWLAATVRGPDNPAFCKQGSDHPSAMLFPVERSM